MRSSGEAISDALVLKISESIVQGSSPEVALATPRHPDYERCDRTKVGCWQSTAVSGASKRTEVL